MILPTILIIYQEVRIDCTVRIHVLANDSKMSGLVFIN